MIESIAVATDFSDAGSIAFLHALRLSVEFKSRLELIHVREPGDRAEWDAFPHVRETLERWGLLPAGSKTEQVFETLGIDVRKVEVRDRHALDGLAGYLPLNRPDLLVMASHGRVGLNRWLSGSVSNEIATTTDIPTLLFGPAAKAFVDLETGTLGLTDVVVSVDHSPSPILAARRARKLLDGLDVAMTFIHVGSEAPDVGDGTVVRLIEDDVVEPVFTASVGTSAVVQRDNVVDAIVEESGRAGLLVMPTAGRHGLLDTLRGSTTERVLHEATCPILAIRSE